MRILILGAVYMNKVGKIIASIIHSLILALCISTSPASAQHTVIHSNDNGQIINQPLAQGPLDQALAPIALYPDSVLSNILVAATYPLEVVQAARWREDNIRLTEEQVLVAIEYEQWDPSVKALTPFADLIAQLSYDLDWLQYLGDAFLQNEYQVLASIQDLRHKAYEHGAIADNKYYDVINDNNYITIESTNNEIIYVPYYDSRSVYGRWSWHYYQPVYWKRPSHYKLHAGFYWSHKFYIRPTIFFGGFHWKSRNLVINHHVYNKPYGYNRRYRNISVSKYNKWKHNPTHRRGVRYSTNYKNKSSIRNNSTNFRSNSIKQNRSNVYNKRTVSNKNTLNNIQNRTNNNRNIKQQTNTRTQRSSVNSNRKANVVKQQTNKKALNKNQNNFRKQSANYDNKSASNKSTSNNAKNKTNSNRNNQRNSQQQSKANTQKSYTKPNGKGYFINQNNKK